VTLAVPERPSTVDPEEPSDLLAHLATRLWLGLLEAALVTAGFFWVLTRAGWSPGDAVFAGSPLHHAHLQATTMTSPG
jgi:hypothetical protein